MSTTTLGRTLQRHGYVCPRCTLSTQVKRQSVRAFHSTRPRQQSVLSLLEERGYVHQIAGYSTDHRLAAHCRPASTDGKVR